MSAEKFRREIDQAIDQWLEKRKRRRESASPSSSSSASASPSPSPTLSPTPDPAPAHSADSSSPLRPAIVGSADELGKEIERAISGWRKREHEQKQQNRPAVRPHGDRFPPARGRSAHPELIPWVSLPDSSKSVNPAFFGQRRTRILLFISVASWVYLALASGVAAFLAWAPESAPGVSALLYGPRWLLIVPWLILLAIATSKRRRALIPLGLALAVVWGPVMGGHWPVIGWFTFPSETPKLKLRVLSCDQGTGALRGISLKTLILKNRLDVVALQNVLIDPEDLKERFPGWSIQAEGDLVTLSRYPIRQFQRITPENDDSKSAGLDCGIETPVGLVRVVNLYLRRTYEQRDQASRHIARTINSTPPALVLGNFNMPAESSIFKRDWGPFQTAFQDAGEGLGFGAVADWTGLRLDHILGNRGWRFSACDLGPNIGADHLPLMAEACWFAR